MVQLLGGLAVDSVGHFTDSHEIALHSKINELVRNDLKPFGALTFFRVAFQGDHDCIPDELVALAAFCR